MTPESSKKLNNNEGQLLGLRAVLASIIESNPSLKLDEKRIDELIERQPLEGGDDQPVRSKAKETKQVLLANRQQVRQNTPSTSPSSKY